MRKYKNTVELWEEISRNYVIDDSLLETTENNILWKRMEQIILKQFITFKNLKVIDIGSGVGAIGALMAKRGAKVTLVDYSQCALLKARELFDKMNISAEYINQDALFLSPDLFNKFDISMSFGLAEHFSGLDRTKIIKTHFDVLRAGGITFISVPNKFNFPYRIYKFVFESLGKWRYGEEYPFSIGELKNICYQLGIKEYFFIGDSLISSFDSFLFQPFISLISKNAKRRFHKLTILMKNKGTFLDQYLSYALVLVALKGRNKQ